MALFTVFTAACNRPTELKRLYDSLVRQTCKDFVWLIVDDSTDSEVLILVGTFLKEDKIAIEYHKQEHRGKYWAQKKGFSMVNTPYMLDIDDDDELTNDCVEVLMREWKKIEKEGKEHIGMICGNTINAKGQLVSYQYEQLYIDSDYIQMEWQWKHPSENLISRRLETIKNVDVFCDKGKWLSEKVALVRESVLWNRIAQKYNCRYVNHPMMIYHTGSHERLSTRCFDAQKCTDYVFSNYSLLNELRGRLWENPKDMVKYVAEYVACGIAINAGFRNLIGHLEGPTLKCTALLLYLPGILVGLFFRHKYFAK